MRLEVLAPLGSAYQRMLAILFRPFELNKWLTLGLAAFLISLGDCSGGGGGNTGLQFQADGSPGERVERALRDVSDWAGGHVIWLVVVGVLVVLIGLGLWLLFTWLASRGEFLLLDGVVRDRAAVSEPWSEYRREGNSLFGFNVAFRGLFGVLVLVAIACGFALAWEDLGRDRFETGSMLALVLCGGFVFLLVIAAGLIGLFLSDFVVPAMYARHLGVMAAWRVTLDEVLRPHAGTIALYVLTRIAVAIGLGLISLGLMCGTLGLACCLLAIPYVGSVVLLPFTVFTRLYSVEFLAQLGPAWTLRAPDAAAS